MNRNTLEGISFSNSRRHCQLLQALDLLHVLVLEVDIDGSIIYANQQAKKHLGETLQIDCLPCDNLLAKLICNQDIPENTPYVCEIFEERSHLWYRIITKRYFLQNKGECCLYVIEDISDWKIMEQTLLLFSATDSLTGTCNRTAGLARIEHTMAVSDPATTHSLIFIDIDALKNINDSWGHCEGDHMIKSVAKALLSSVRSADVVCRYGGDEFLVLLENCSEAAASATIERADRLLRELENEECKPYQISFSYGIVSFCVDSGRQDQINELLNTADRRMYQNKREKKVLSHPFLQKLPVV